MAQGTTQILILVRWLLISQIFFCTRFYFIANVIELTIFILVCIDKDCRARIKKIISQPAVSLVFIFLIWVGLSGIWSDASFAEKIDDFLSWRKLLLFVVAAAVSDCRLFRLRVLVVFLATGIFYLILSLVPLYTGKEFWLRDASEVLQNHSAQGVWFMFSSFLIFYVLFICFDDCRVTIKSKLIMMSLGLIFLISVVGFNSGRSGSVVFVLGISYVFLLGLVKSEQTIQFVAKFKTITAALILLIGATAIQSRFFITGLESAIDGMLATDAGSIQTSSGTRVVMWLNTWRIIQENWFWGVGSGAFLAEYASRVEGIVGWPGLVTDNPHQQFLHIWARYGLVGLGIFVAFLGSCLYRFYILRQYFLQIVWISAFILCFVNGVYSGFVIGRLLLLLYGAFYFWPINEDVKAYVRDR